MRHAFARALAAIDPQRLTFGAAALLILALLTINGLIVWHDRENTLAEVRADLRKMSLALAGQADRTFQSVDLVLQNIAERIAAEGIDDAPGFARAAGTRAMHDLLIAKLTGLPQLDAITVID